MPKYMLLLYAGEGDAQERKRRESELPQMIAVAESLRDAGVLLAADRLYPVEAATTVRVRDQETEILDGPFAVTKEYLGGYFLLDCADLDEALRHAARLPLARYGSIEVRPVMDLGLPVAAGEEGSATAP
jgi:hypothetical protein